MYKNLDAEQARYGISNTEMAEKLGLSRVSYENKKKSGKFTAIEAKIMCEYFHVSFEYLFDTNVPDLQEA